MQIHERIKELREEKDLKPPELAERIGISKTSQYKYENGSTIPPADYLAKLAAEGLDSAYILTGKRSVPEGFVKIPRMSALGSMGGGVPSDINHDEVIDQITISEDWLKTALPRYTAKQNLCIVGCVGDSMEPTLKNGDTVFVDTGVTEFQQEAIYMFEVFGDVRIKRLQRIAHGDVKILSDNKLYDPIILHRDDPLRIIGKVIGRFNFQMF